VIKIALAQINCVVGDIEANSRKIVEWTNKAREQKADLVVFPELAITGYPPEDLIFKSSFIDQNLAALEMVAETIRGIAAIVGFVDRKEGLYNALALLEEGRVSAVYHKQKLPNYSVFDEKRYFSAGKESGIVTLKGTRIALAICEDLWYEMKIDSDIDLLVSINASPFSHTKLKARFEILKKRSRELNAPIYYVNLVGAQDELVFDGQSAVIGADGELRMLARPYEEELLICDDRQNAASVLPPMEQIYGALKLGLRDYVRKNGFRKVVLGLSGGVDSALAAVIAADAIGAENVVCVLMPSPFSSKGSVEDALLLAENIGAEKKIIPIGALMEEFDRALSDHFQGKERDVTEENIQARLRGAILMALSNKFNYLVLATGNKSEMSVGYATLYGDMCGGFAPIKDVLKTDVYKLCEYRNGVSEVIPKIILTKPPSAELRLNQTDQDELPDYETLDAIVKLYIEEDRSISYIEKLGFDRQVVSKMASLIDRNEYKRSQSPIGTKISDRAFGKDRRMPITCRGSESIRKIRCP
jgi:NAD+ synthase (glutamine-hydrolysing)